MATTLLENLGFGRSLDRRDQYSPTINTAAYQTDELSALVDHSNRVDLQVTSSHIQTCKSPQTTYT
jgi:hypothetical protein